MLKIGVTGGIGSGKSHVCKVFEELEVPVYYADKAAKEIVDNSEIVIDAIKDTFGNDIYEKGVLNRKKMAGIAFRDVVKLSTLNEIIHPLVIANYNDWLVRHKDVPYVLKEAAILFESGSHRELDQIIAVYAPYALRLHRVMARDEITEEEVIDRMKNQMPEEKKMKRSHYIIYNDGKQVVRTQVIELHEKLVALSKELSS